MGVTVRNWQAVECSVSECSRLFTFDFDEDCPEVWPLVTTVFWAVCPHCDSKNLYQTHHHPSYNLDNVKKCTAFVAYNFLIKKDERRWFG
jgi:hypothetical protein